ncbi:ABC transporter substrate-binding protein [Paenibacillus sepulcri]|uniref:Extracellular solute-binding protein n=1 Tax=Paenibacillus sepulcri TaxID=359917 RepID=A0ABS7C4C7_9BACL|nr:extracellular solute-binding protein [Paenibacillus sepulcri]
MKKTGFTIVMCLILLCLSACTGNSGSGGNSAGSDDTASVQNPGKPDAGGNNAAGTNGQAQGGNEAPDGPVKLVFATFTPSEQLQSAKKKYEAAHPNVEIELQTAQAEFTDLDTQLANIDKFVTTTNTAMLAGKGPDLMELDMLPAGQYASRNLLADFNDLMKQDATFRKEDYFANILDNTQIGGGLYGLPLSFFLDGMVGDKDAIAKAGVQVDDSNWTWNDFVETAKQLAEKGEYPNALGSSPTYLLTEMASDNYALFVDEANRKAKFDSASFTSLMEQVKKMFDDGVVFDALAGGKRTKVHTYFQETQIQSPMEYLMTLSGYDGEGELYTKPHAQELGAGGYFTPNRTIGINAASPVKQQAWDFVKFILSEQGEAEPDLSLGNTGFAISRIAFDKQIKELRAKGEVPAYKNGPAETDAFKFDPALLDGLEGSVTEAVHSVGRNSKITDIITEESEAFFKGQKSAADVAKLIQSKADLFLNE